MGKNWQEQRKITNAEKKSNTKILDLEIRYQGLADEIAAIPLPKLSGNFIGIFFTVDAIECRKYLKKRGKQISRKLKKELILETKLLFRQPVVFMKMISRHFLAIVFKNSGSINIFELKNFQPTLTINLEAQITCLVSSLMPGPFEDHQEQMSRAKVDLEALNYRQPYLIACGIEGKIHLINIGTLALEHSFYASEDARSSKPITNCFTSVYDCCLVSVDTEMFLRIHRIDKISKITLMKSYDLVALIKKICANTSMVMSQLALESSSVNIRKVGQQHIFLSVSKTLHLFKITESFQMRHEATFFSGGGDIYPFDSEQLLNLQHRPAARRYFSMSQKQDQEQYLTDVDVIDPPCAVFLVNGSFFEFDIANKRLHLIYQKKSDFSRLQLLEHGYRSDVGSIWRFLRQKSDGDLEVVEIVRKVDHRVESGVISILGLNALSVDSQVMDLRYKSGEEGVNLIVDRLGDQNGLRIQIYKFD